MTPPEADGRVSCFPFEEFRKIRGFIETQLTGDLVDRQVRVREQSLGLEQDTRGDDMLRGSAVDLESGTRQASLCATQRSRIISDLVPACMLSLDEFAEFPEALLGSPRNCIVAAKRLVKQRQPKEQRTKFVLQQGVDRVRARGHYAVRSHTDN